jgi:hypothetical protein
MFRLIDEAGWYMAFSMDIKGRQAADETGDGIFGGSTGV